MSNKQKGRRVNRDRQMGRQTHWQSHTHTHTHTPAYAHTQITTTPTLGRVHLHVHAATHIQAQTQITAKQARLTLLIPPNPGPSLCSPLPQEYTASGCSLRRANQL